MIRKIVAILLRLGTALLQQITAHIRQFLYLGLILIGAVFVLLYRGLYWPFIRAYMGDWLVVQFIYVVARFGIGFRWRYHLAVSILLFSILVEIIQLLMHGSIPRTFAMEVTIGSTFDPLDIAAYALGLVMALFIERFWKA